MHRGHALLLLVGCGRVDFERSDAHASCTVAPVRLSASSNADEVDLSIAETPDGVVVFVAPTNGGGVRLQRFTDAWQPIDSSPRLLGVDRSAVSALWIGQLIVALDTGAGTEIARANITEGAIDLATAGTTASRPLRNAIAHDMTTAAVAGYAAGGFQVESLAADGTPLGNLFAAGFVDVYSSEGAAAAGERFFTFATGYATYVACFVGVVDLITRVGTYAYFGTSCHHLSVALDDVSGFAVYETELGLGAARWALDSLATTSVVTASSGERPFAIVGDRGVFIAWRDLGGLVAAWLDPATLAPRSAPTQIMGVPYPLGMTGRRHDGAVELVVAATDGLYLVCP